MASLNKVFLMGNISIPPNAKNTQGGMQVAEFGIAVNYRYKDRQGGEKEESCFLDVECFGKVAEYCVKRLRKGMPVFMEGRLRMLQWTDQATQKKRTKIKILAESVTVLERNAETPANGNERPGRFDMDCDNGY